MRIGVFGGTFDPPHVGHLILAAEALDQTGLDRLFWVLTPDPPHKQNQLITPLEQRVEMVLAAIQDNPRFSFSRADMDRPSPHYSVDTVSLFRDDFPDSEIVFLMGGDSLHNLPMWHKADELVNVVDYLGVMRRPGDEVHLNHLITKFPQIKKKIIWIDAPLLEISSRQIRQRFYEGRSVRYYLPESVYRWIVDNQLYIEASHISEESG